MRILGLDFGSKTVGVAVSDELLLTAQGLEIVRRQSPNKLRQTLARIEEIIAEYKVERIVLGYPKNMNNTEGERCEKTKEFKEMLEKRTGLEVILWDERLTTVAADEAMIGYACAAAEAVNPGHSRIGRVASGDQFVSNKKQKQAIIADTGALCTEMEGAAIAHAAYRNEIPFVIIRAISDKADDSAEMDYPTFERIAAHHCASVTMMLAKKLA